MDTKKYKIKLENELKLLESEISKIAQRNPENPDEWEAVETDLNSDKADDDEVADELENFDENESLLQKLQKQYDDIKIALEKIENGTYGKCEVGGENIPEKRLEANPSARTCIEHSKK
jgi:RNA polymerase-binding transcription factor DksA